MCTDYLQVNRADVILTFDTQLSPDIFLYILADTNPDMTTKYTSNSSNNDQQ